MRKQENFFRKYKKNIFSIAFLLILGIVTFSASVSIYSNMINKNTDVHEPEEITTQTQSITSKTIDEQKQKENQKKLEEAIQAQEELKKQAEEQEKVNETKNTKAQTNTKSKETKKEPVVKDPIFVAPILGEVVKKYAKDELVYSETLDEWITHTGLDIAGDKGAGVRASSDGTIKSIKTDPRYGITVIIEHVNGFKTVYANLEKADCKEGDKIKQGQLLGTVGMTASFESLDKPHLHFEILKGEEYLNPNDYIKL